MVAVTSRITFSGPFFTKDPRKTVRGNIRDMLDDLAAEMEQDVKGQIKGHAGQMPRYSGWTHDHVRGRTESLSGKRWALSAVVSADSSGMDRSTAIRTKAAAATIERRWHPFRRTATAVRRIKADLAKGLE